MRLPLLAQLERTISKQDAEVRHVKEKLTSHDAAAKRAVATLQEQLKLRVDQVSGKSGYDLIYLIARVNTIWLYNWMGKNLTLWLVIVDISVVRVTI